MDVPTSRALARRPALAWLVGFGAGSLVNAVGVAVWVAGAGMSGYWVPVAVTAVAGAAVATMQRFRWLGLGLAAGCVAEALVLSTLGLAWGILAGS